MVTCEEQWLPFCSYEVSNFGRVKSAIGKITYGWERNGYKSFTAASGKYYVHRVVATLFCDGKQVGLLVDHKDECKTNNHFSNLRWVTVKQNSKVSRLPRKRISKELVGRMVVLKNMGFNNTQISKALGLDRRNVSRTLNGRVNSKWTGIIKQE
jgi:hypothetical protein